MNASPMATPEREHWMSEQELAEARELVGGAPEPEAAAAPGGLKPAKLSMAKKNQMLFSAALSGNVFELKNALEMGADPNGQERSYPYRTAMDAMLEAGADPACFLELMRAGGISNRYYGKPDGARKAAKEAQESPEKWEPIRHLIGSQLVSLAPISLMMKASQQWAELGVSAPTDQQWFERCVEGNQIAKAWGFAKERGCQAGAAAWKRLVGCVGMARRDEPEAREAFLELLRSQGRSMEPEQARALYTHALKTDDAEMLLALLRAQLRPSPNWAAPIPVSGERRWNVRMVSCPLLVGAKALGAAACFETLRRFKPALRHIGVEYDIELLKLVSVTDALELDELGARLQTRKGENILHVWAEADKQQPRAGWPTLAKRKPDFLTARVDGGKSALESQLSFLSDDAAQEFEKSLARVEARELAREVGAKPKKKAGAPSRPRL